MKYYTIILILLFGCEDLKEPPPAEEVVPRRVTVSIYQFGVQYINELPYVWAKGKVKNYGPGSIYNIEVHLQTNYGTPRIAYSVPWALAEGEIADWEISPTYGTYIKSRKAVYGE